jgi:hypothetical protein
LVILVRKSPTKLRAPVLNNPVLKINIAATVTVAVLLNPEIPSSGVIMPVSSKDAIIINAVRSTGILSLVNKKIAPARIIKTMIIAAIYSTFVL